MHSQFDISSNWDYVDPKLLETIEALNTHQEYFSAQQKNQQENKTILFKDRCQLLQSTKHISKRLNSLISQQNDKLLDYFDKQIQYSSKSKFGKSK